MRFFDRFANVLQRLLPSPFTIAILLSLVVFLGALFFARPEDVSTGTYALDLLGAWEDGLWQDGPGGLYFAFQMMLILILGHVLALTPFFSRLIDKLLVGCVDTASSAAIITFSTIFIAYVNWGLGLIFGAILARKIGEKFNHLKKPLNYGLIGACGYVGLMVWHGGLSGSAPTKANEAGNLASFFPDNQEMAAALPERLSLGETVFSPMNITASILLLLIIPTVIYFFAKKQKSQKVPEIEKKSIKTNIAGESAKGMGKLDQWRFFSSTLGVLIIGFAFYKAFILPAEPSLKVITPNFLNFLLLGLGLLLHANINRFLKAVDEAIGGASGILIQFPLYFGMMAMLNASGLIQDFSSSFASIASETTFPLYTFFSAGLVNLFVPSGGGQWVVQGPVILQAAVDLNVPIHKTVMALSYGDQLTNMLQPFWALPLLGITGLKARDILPYTLLLFLLGFVIFVGVLLVF